MKRCNIVFQDEHVIIVAKPAGISGAKLEATLESDLPQLLLKHGEGKGTNVELANKTRASTKVAEPATLSVHAPLGISSNTFDLGIIAKSDAVKEWLGQCRRNGSLERITVALVHDLVDQSAARHLEKSSSNTSNEDDVRIKRVHVLQHFRTNQNSSGWLSLIKVTWSPINSNSVLKARLFQSGFPVVGSGRNTVSLNSKSSKGKMFATVGVRFPMGKIGREGQQCEVEVQDEAVERMTRVGEREASFWNKKTLKRKATLMDSCIGMSEGEVEEHAASRNPVAHVSGFKSFCGLRFDASDKVFVPQDGSVCIVDTAVQIATNNFNDNEVKSILDLGCGSGCLLLSTLHKLPETWTGVGVDVNPQAIDLSLANAKRNSLCNRAQFVEASYTSDSFHVDHRTPFHILLCNPPYLPANVATSLEVTKNAPSRAVSAGEDGLQMYMEIANSCAAGGALRRLCQNGCFLVLEVPGNRSAKHERIQEMFKPHMEYVGYGLKDKGGMNRCLIFKFV